MVDVVKSSAFDGWSRTLKGRRAAARVLIRIDRLAAGTRAPGYRAHYLREGDRLILLLCGGDKSTQRADITAAHDIAQNWRANQGGDR